MGSKFLYNVCHHNDEVDPLKNITWYDNYSWNLPWFFFTRWVVEHIGLLAKLLMFHLSSSWDFSMVVVIFHYPLLRRMINIYYPNIHAFMSWCYILLRNYIYDFSGYCWKHYYIHVFLEKVLVSVVCSSFSTLGVDLFSSQITRIKIIEAFV